MCGGSKNAWVPRSMFEFVLDKRPADQRYVLCNLHIQVEATITFLNLFTMTWNFDYLILPVCRLPCYNSADCWPPSFDFEYIFQYTLAHVQNSVGTQTALAVLVYYIGFVPQIMVTQYTYRTGSSFKKTVKMYLSIFFILVVVFPSTKMRIFCALCADMSLFSLWMMSFCKLLMSQFHWYRQMT